MLKKLLKAAAILGVIGGALYFFNIPPFEDGGIFRPKSEQLKGVARTETTTDTETTSEQAGNEVVAPVERTKTFDEHMTRGEVLYQNGYTALAIAEFEAAKKQNPSSPEPATAIGKIHFEKAEYLEAKVALQEALKLSPNNLEANIALGKTFIAERDLPSAEQLFNSLPVHNQVSKYYQGLVTIAGRDHETGKALLRDSINLGPDITLHQYAQNYLGAYDEFNANQGSPNAHLLTLLGRSFSQTGEYHLAIPVLFDAIAEKKDYRDAWIVLGYSYLRIQKYQDAVDALEEAKKLDSQKPTTLFFLGLAYWGLGDLNQAITYLESAKVHNYQPAVQIEQKLAEIYLQKQQYEKAAESFEQVVTLNDSDGTYFIKPMWIYIEKLNQPEKALTLAMQAVESSPDSALTHNLLGWAYLAINDTAQAKTALEKALALDPKLDAIYLNYGALYEQQGNISAALRSYQHAHKLGQGNSISAAAATKYNELIEKTNQSDTFMVNIFGQ